MVGSTYNHVVGADGVYIPGEHQRVLFSVLGSLSRRGVTEEERRGGAATLSYMYDTRSFVNMSYFERYTRDFAMDTAFYERIGFARGQTVFGLKYYPDPKRFSWAKIVIPFTQMSYLDDAFTGMHDKVIAFGVQANFTRQGFASVSRNISRESWAGKYFHPTNTFIGGRVQAMNWLFISGDFSTGNRILYDTTAPFLGEGKSYSGGINIQPNDKFSQSLEYRYSDLTNPSNDERVYTVHIVNTRSTYQFNRYFFLRVILQYDSYGSSLLQDYLASFTFIPGTVVHFGYGSLLERNELRDDGWVKGAGSLRPVRECLFFKTSYLHHF
jgi:hypothetical protein